MDLHKTLCFMFPVSHFNDWTLTDTGSGPAISVWNRTEPQPTTKQLEAVAPTVDSALFAKNNTPINQIHALEQVNDDSQRKLNRQAAIDTALTIATRNPAAAGMTRDQVHAAYYASNRGYKSMVDLETACAALRKLIVV